MMFCRWFLVTAIVALADGAGVHAVEEIVAKVNGDIITRGEIERARQAEEEELQGQGLSGAHLIAAIREAEKNALRNQIDQLLLVQRGKDLNLNVDSELTRRIAQIQSESAITDLGKFHNYIREQTGTSFEEFRDRLRRQLLTERVITEEVRSRIAIPEADLKKYYEVHGNEFVREEQVFLSQILISTEGKTAEQVAALQKKAVEVLSRARRGEDFGDLARQNSDDAITASDGGRLPPYKWTEHLLRKEIEDIVFRMKKGAVTDPIKTSIGLLILKVDERFEAGQATFDEVRDEISDKLVSPMMEPKLREYLTRLRQSALMEIKEGYVDIGAAPGQDTRWMDVAQLITETTSKEEVVASAPSAAPSSDPRLARTPSPPAGPTPASVVAPVPVFASAFAPLPAPAPAALAMHASPRTEAAAYHARGRGLLREERFPEAIEQLTEAVKLDPFFPEAYNARGFAYLRLKRYKEAIDDFTEAIRLNPAYVNAYVNRSAARNAARDKAGAAADQVKAHELANY
jgi:peptidyl-prolyl cis-trans isomerase SurA